jgi:hypothetical protein
VESETAVGVAFGRAFEWGRGAMQEDGHGERRFDAAG